MYVVDDSHYLHRVVIPASSSWRLTDTRGRAWILRFAPYATARATPGVIADARQVVSLLVEEALAPWAEPSPLLRRSDVLASVLGVLGHDIALDPAFSRRSVGDRTRGWSDRIGRAREILLGAIATGRLTLERDAPHARAPLDEESDSVADPPLPPVETLGTLELRVVDEAGAPVSGLALSFSVDGARVSVTTDGDGVARATDVAASFGSARIDDVKALRALIEPRWCMFRPTVIAHGDDVTVAPIATAIPTVTVETGKLRTLVILPNHRRVRLVGMHFDTSKCFLLPSAMRGIRAVRSFYDETASTSLLVVGHTDARGARAYNEKLSLERAEAIVAYLKDDVEAWTAWFSSGALEKRWGDRETAAMLSVLPEGGPTFGASSSNAARDPAVISAFQRWSNVTRGTALVVDGDPGPKTRGALVAAYMALDHTTLPVAASIASHGCGPNQPLPPDEQGNPRPEAEQRRVDIFVFDGPVRPAPPGATSGPSSPHYPQWVAQMASTVDVTNEDLSFQYAVEVGDSQQWTEAATILLAREDGRDTQSFVLGSGERSGSLRFFVFDGIRRGSRYRAEIVERELRVPLFDFTELHGVVAHDVDAGQLVLPSGRPAAPFSDVDVTDSGILRVRLFDPSGEPMMNAFFRIAMGGTTCGYAEDGWVAVPLPPFCPASALLEWGDPDEHNCLPYRMDLELGCNEGAGDVTGMLHNLGYPRTIDLDTRVRAFQGRHGLAEAGLTAAGTIPPRTEAEIRRAYAAMLV